MAPREDPPTSNTGNRIDVIDVIGSDPKTGEVVLMMNEADEWNGSDEQLLALQERFNAYASFLLDGEMAESHPELAGKTARIEVRCVHMPDARALELLALIHDQLRFQEIKLEVVVQDEPPSPKATE
ncbi:MAG: DUF6572 domain-containing protein [Candidatus Udaeobacter sp.]